MSNNTPLLVFQGQLDQELINVLVSKAWFRKGMVDMNELIDQAVLEAALEADAVCIESNVCPPLENFRERQVLLIIPNIKTNLSATEAQTALMQSQLPQSEIYHIGALMIDLEAWQVTRNEQAIALSVTELNFLAYLARRHGQVVSYENLLSSVWDYSAGTGDRKVVSNCVRRLRKKLGERAKYPEYIVSVPSIGYRLRKQ